MAHFVYNGTITFKPHWSFEQKKCFIVNIFEWLEKKVIYDRRKGVEYYFEYVVEYHKVEGQDDLEAPHIHFVMVVNKYLPKYLFNSYLSSFSDIGRAQMYLATSMKAQNYYNYIMKDVEKNIQLDESQGYRHWVSKMLIIDDFNSRFVIDDFEVDDDY